MPFEAIKSWYEIKDHLTQEIQLSDTIWIGCARLGMQSRHRLGWD